MIVAPFSGPALLLGATLASIELTWATAILGRFGELGRLGRRSTRLVLRTRVSEWAKERALRLMSQRLMGHSLRASLLLAVVAAPFALALGLDRHGALGVTAALTNWPARIFLLVLSTAYLLARRRSRLRGNGEASPQPRGERLLQRIALGNAAVRDMSFDIERNRHHPVLSGRGEPGPLFVTGLARAGTTILTRMLHEQQGLASLTYRDLPFPLAPNSWAALGRGMNRHVDRAERGHGDGIEHDLDSPEAIEEVFWRHFEGSRYARPEGLDPVAPTAETIEAFRTYVGLIRRRYGAARYLSKNNGNILRLPALVEAFPDAHLIHPFRSPLQHAASLHRQHAKALELAAQDPFRAQFMGWLGHHEFGADQRPFLFPGHPAAEAPRAHIDYWLQAWTSVHTALLNAPAPVRARQVFLDFDALCRDGAAYAAPLAEELRLTRPFQLDDLRQQPTRLVHGATPRLLRAAEEVHAELIARSLPAQRAARRRA